MMRKEREDYLKTRGEGGRKGREKRREEGIGEILGVYWEYNYRGIVIGVIDGRRL